MIHVRRLTVADAAWLGLEQALTDASLPTEDLQEPNQIFLGFYADDGRSLGYGGLQLLGEDALVRSVVSAASARGTGVGRFIVSQLLDVAEAGGASTAWLLTMTGKAFFERQGFVTVERAEAPPDIAKTREFQGLCPQTAALLRYALQA